MILWREQGEGARGGTWKQRCKVPRYGDPGAAVGPTFNVRLVVSLEIPVSIQFTLRSPSPSPSPSISSTLPRAYDHLWSSGVVCCFLLIPSLPSSHHIMQRAFASAPRAALRSSRVNAGSLTQQRFAHKVRRHQLNQEHAQDGY